MDVLVLAVSTRSAAQTRRVAAALARCGLPGDVLALDGELGAGKTCFAAGFVAALDGATEVRVSSPTFTTVNTYATRPPVYHMDLYRLRDAEELLFLGHEDYVESDGICLIEWWSRAPDVLPEDHLRLHIAVRAGNRRRLVMQCQGERSRTWLLEAQRTQGIRFRQEAWVSRS